MRLAIDIGFHGRDMAEMVFGSLKRKQRGRNRPRCLFNRLWRMSDRAEKVGQAHNAGKTHQGTEGDTPARLLETAFHGNST
jgi:hypothetical protein